ncbi:MAG TPA: carboxymuconolactone decarboxylase family protein [Kofleriaceae bacterium]|jgi:AhpD family alkylhydroperoxidase|nr:carboxymuconolactone decarboxylase family protein [Kofleriaceae bacterium]
MKARLNFVTALGPEAITTMQALAKLTENGSVPPQTLRLVHLRVSQINGCSVCVDLDRRFSRAADSDERLFMVSAWRDAPVFSDAERAALALAEAVTRLPDRSDPVPDDVWNEAARHYDERGLSTLVLMIAVANTWNRLNVATRQVAGEWAKSADAKALLEKGRSASH